MKTIAIDANQPDQLTAPNGSIGLPLGLKEGKWNLKQTCEKEET